MRYLLCIVCVVVVLSSKAQLRTETNQYMVYQPLINFSAATSYNEPSAALFYRKQWVGFSGAPEHYGVRLAVPVSEKSSVFGLGFIRDKIGVRTEDEITLDYGYRLKLSQKVRLGLSLSGKVKFFSKNYTALIVNDAQDPSTAVNIKESFIPNADFGAYLFSRKFYVGFSLPDLLVNKVSTSSVESSFNFQELSPLFQAGYEFKLGAKNALGVSTLIKSDAGASVHADLNLMYYFNQKTVGIGVSVRTSKDIVPIISIAPTKEFRVGYAFQYNYDGLSDYQSGTHEILLTYQRKSKKNLVKLYAPRF
ncbi:MAG: type IX secretion system membrane protein PorP/SprF [Flavobacteriales bacterium]|nr:type IX secretion system membrane protein PorP/SprF [Flavobacteriales bacterium]